MKIIFGELDLGICQKYKQSTKKTTRVECKIWQMVLWWTQDAQHTFEKEECSEQLKVFHEYDKTGELVDWEEFYNLYNK